MPTKYPSLIGLATWDSSSLIARNKTARAIQVMTPKGIQPPGSRPIAGHFFARGKLGLTLPLAEGQFFDSL